MTRRERNYEVELDGETCLVRVEDCGAAGPGMGQSYRIWIGDADPVEVVGEELNPGSWSLLSEGRSWEAGVTRDSDGGRGDCSYEVDILGVPHFVHVVDPMRKALRLAGSEGGALIKAAMPGRVIRVLVEPGQSVAKGEPILVLEAMKMENEIKAPREGSVARVAVSPGDLVDARALLVELA